MALQNVPVRLNPTALFTQGHPEVMIPAVDICENDEELLVIADMPGVDPKSLEVNFAEERLTFYGTWTPQLAQNNKTGNGNGKGKKSGQNGQQDEIVEYRRTLVLGAGIDAAKVQAKLKEGVLHVHLPKSASKKRHQVKVKTS
ncbi:MAG: Hsp20/alpha crystallin family protein [Bradymonadaceae bacterium]|nr:Hsp20/alpha crystallin family protein [Lujinxingiaceae bacterium]